MLSRKRNRSKQIRRARSLLIEFLEERRVMNADWQNPGEPTDVNDDLNVGAIDALLIINDLSRNGAREAPPRAPGARGSYLDVTGDGFIGVIDALRVINRLSQGSPIITAKLANDSGSSDIQKSDRVTNDFSVIGRIVNLGSLEKLELGFGLSPTTFIEITDKVTATGSFTIDAEEIRTRLGSPVADGENLQTIRLTSNSTTIVEVDFPFTLDTTPPTPATFGLDAASRQTSDNPALTNLGQIGFVGQAQPGQTVTLIPNNVVVTATTDGSFDFSGLPINDGLNPFAVFVEDIAGNTATTNLSVSKVMPSPVGQSSFVLAEGSKWLSEQAFLIDLEHEIGSRRLSFEISASFDVSDLDVLVGDLLQVYLVDPMNPGQTLLDRGREGEALFSWSETGADFLPGLVTFNGTTVTVDLTSLATVEQGLLVFQLINGDADENSNATIGSIVNVVDEEGVASPVFPSNTLFAQPGVAVDIAAYNVLAKSAMQIIIENVRVDGEAGTYLADLILRNTGTQVSRALAARFNNLPAGVVLRNASGIDASGKPYLNLSPAVLSGGLDVDAITTVVELSIANPNALRFELDIDVLSAGPNRPPELTPIPTQTVMPGGRLEIQLDASDPDGDRINYTLQADRPLPRGSIDSGMGILVFSPKSTDLGTYQVEAIAADGALTTTQSFTLNVVADPVTTTRISGRILDVDQTPIAGMRVELGGVQGLTQGDGTFTLDLGPGPLVSDTLKVRGELFVGIAYPFIAEKLPLLLEHDVQPGVNNVIARPIFLPQLDIANGMTINPTSNTTVTSAALPGTSVFVAAGTLMNQQGIPFTGLLSITEVPRDRTPAALPKNLIPDLVVTIQPGEMVFATPAPMTFPNPSGWAPGTLMNLWSINPTTGQFDDVGDMRVSADGSLIETISGGVRNSSWHFASPPPPPEMPPSSSLDENQDEICNRCEATVEATSSVELHSGAVLESHSLVSYQSLGAPRGLNLHYNSQQADPRPIVNFRMNNVLLGQWRYVYARLRYSDGDTTYSVPGFDPTDYSPISALDPVWNGYAGNEHLWTVPPGVAGNNLLLALQADLRHLPTGVYSYELERGLIRGELDDFLQAVRLATIDSGELLVVNQMASSFGAGWSLGGIQQLVETAAGSLLLVDGDGASLVFRALADQPGAYQSPAGDFSTLVKNPDGSFTRTTPERMVYQYDLAGRLVSLTDRNGNVTSHEYENGRLAKIVDPVGLETRLTYSGERVSAITDPAGRVTLLEHDAAGNLIRITDPDGSSRTFEYDSAHHLIAEVDQVGQREQTQYGFHGRATGAIRKDGSTLSFDPVQTRALLPAEQTADVVDFFSFDPVTNSSQVHFDPPRAPSAPSQTRAVTADANGNTLATVLDKAGQTVRTFDALGALPSVARNSDNLVVAATDGRGFTTQYRYDERGNLVSVTDAVSRGVSLGEVTFPGEKFPAGARPYSVTLGDFNRDGVLDLAVANLGNDVSVMLGIGDGRFQPQQRFAAGSGPRAIVVGDFNGDGALDLATANSGSRDVSVLIGVGDGTFQTQQRFATGNGARSIALGDFNGDSVPDMAITNSQDHDVSVLLGNGDGTFQTQQRFAVGSNPYGVIIADINGDGLPDVLSANRSSNDLSALLGNGDGTFATQQSLATGTGPMHVAAGDVNGDGIVDLAVTNFDSNDISVLLGSGGGAFENEQRVASGVRSFAIIMGDFNGDGQTDLAVADNETATAAVVAGNGDGTFQAPQRVAVGGNPTSLVAGDVNGDGAIDLAVANFSSNDVSVLLGNAGGTFNNQSTATVGRRPSSVTTGDFNGDGLQDIAVGNFFDYDVSILLSNGDGTFQPQRRFFVGSRPVALSTADLNGDGIADLAVANETSNDVSILLGNGDGTFQTQQTFATGTRPRSVQIADFNGDGFADLAVANYNNHDVSVLLGNGDGTFQTQQRFGVGSNPPSVTVADFNGDGVPDLATANEFSADVSVLFGNGDGTFRTQARFAAGTRPRSVTTGDFNGDGIADLAIANADSNGTIAVLLGNGDGTLSAAQLYPMGSSAIPVFVTQGDMNNDGILDLVTANALTDDISVLRGNGDGTFQTPRQFPASVGASGRDVAVGDFNGDGLADLTTNNEYSNNVSVLLGNRGTAGTGPVQPILYTYDDTFSQVTSMTDELGRATLFELDPLTGNRLAVIQVVGQRDSAENGETDDLVTTFAYSPQGLVEQVTDPLGRITQFAHNTAGRLSSTTYALGTTVEATHLFEHDAAGNLVAQTDASGNRTQFAYDVMNRVIRATQADPDGDAALGGGPLVSPVTTLTYDNRGRLTGSVDAEGNELVRQYDPLDRLTLAEDSLGQQTAWTYDLDGRLISLTDPNGLITRYAYDVRDRQISQTAPDGGLMQFRYDSDGNLLSLTDPSGNQTSFAYDARNRLVREVDPLGAESLYAYDRADNLVQSIDRNGRIISFAYDDLHRLVEERWLDPISGQAVNTITFAYDKVSNVIELADAFSQLAFTFDPRNRLLAADHSGTPGAPAVVLTYAYDAVGNLLSVSESIDGQAGAATAYQYDALHRMISVQQSGGGATEKLVDFVYNQLGQWDSISRYSDLARGQLAARSRYAYDEVNRLTRLEHLSVVDQALAFYDFQYDAASRITALTDVDGHTGFSYDDRDQLTGASRDVADTRGDEDYTYDANGNRVDSHLHGSGYVTGANNRLLSDGTFNYAYDDEGNMILKANIATGEVREFERDHRNRLTRVTDRFSVGGIITQEVEYVYDAMNRRIAKTVDADGEGVGGERTEHYVYDRMHVALEFIDADGSGAAEQPELTLRNLFGPGIDQILAQEDIVAAQTRWLLTDHLGTVHDIVSDAGIVLNHILYDSFGNILSQSDPSLATRYAFTGREFDAETGLHYFRARYYDAQLGRFIGEDPIGMAGGDVNLNRYVGNAPLNGVDPMGQSAADVALIQQTFNNWILRATMEGRRLEGGTTNNISLSIQFFTALLAGLGFGFDADHGRTLLGCGEQWQSFNAELIRLRAEGRFEDTWSFNWQGGWVPWPHQWGMAISENPDDPAIRYDPWGNRFEFVDPVEARASVD